MAPTSVVYPDQAATGSRPGAHSGLFTALLWVQGVYYLATGVWPLVSIETFPRVTGRKTAHLVPGRETDRWLVMTVGVLVTAIAAALLVAAWGGETPRKWRFSP